MSTPAGNSVPLLDSGEPHAAEINGLVQGGRWELAGPREITYSFSIETDFIDPETGVGFEWTPELKAGARAAMASWSAVANVTFREVDPADDIDASLADLAMAPTGNLLYPVLAFGFFPDPVAADVILAALGGSRAESPRIEGDIYFDSFNPVFSYLGPGGSGRAAFIHEVGHAIGLKHPHDDGLNGRPTFDELGIAGQDSTRYTVMSYNDPAGVTIASGNPATPMLDDILAIQRIYGANMASSGNNTYSLTADGAMRAIWDAGGIDTLSFAAIAAPLDIRLEEGEFIQISPSTVAAIAYNVTIEHAVGGSGADTIVGNAADNRLDGGPGGDRLDGAAGADTLVGGAGDDWYLLRDAEDVVQEFGGGFDRATVYFTSLAPIAMAGGLDRMDLDEAAADAGVLGNALGNRILGNSFANRLQGGGGNDTLTAAPEDTLEGGPGDDLYDAGTPPFEALLVELPGEGTDTILVRGSFVLPDNFENATLDFAGEADLTGNGAANVLAGNVAQNVLDGRGGTDTLVGGAGNDTYLADGGDVIVEAAGKGTDTAILAASAFPLAANVENAQLAHGAGNLALIGNALANEVLGNNRRNYVDGGAGNDTVEGGAGYDTLLGGAGNDYLDGGRGVDVMEGGAGNDTYVVNSVRDAVIELPGGGVDTVLLSARRYSLPDNVENVEIISTGGSRVTGNALANRLDGGAGNDTLEGGAGADRFVFDEAPGAGGVDRLPDFVHGVDKLLFDDAVFGVPVFGEDLVYYSSTGELSFEGETLAWLGSGTEHPALTAADIAII